MTIDEKLFNENLELAERGDRFAEYTIGRCYYQGKGVEQDYKKAVEWFKKSAEQGDMYAECSLGNCYKFGEGVDQDLYKAVELLKMSAEKDNTDAIGILNKLGFSLN